MRQHAYGFTIVELIVTMVVIAVLATITGTLFSKSLERSNTSTAQSAAARAMSKANSYNTESPEHTYPKTYAALTGASATTSYKLTGVTFTTSRLTGSTRPSNSSTLNFFICTTGSAAEYYDYRTKTWIAVYTGGATGIGGAGTSDCTYQAS